MKFEQIYGLLFEHQEALRYRAILLAGETLREIYDCVTTRLRRRRHASSLGIW